MTPFPGCIVITEQLFRFYLYGMDNAHEWLQYKCAYYSIISNRTNVAYDVYYFSYGTNHIAPQVIP